MAVSDDIELPTAADDLTEGASEEQRASASAAVRYAKHIRGFSTLIDGRGRNHAVLTSFFGKLFSAGFARSKPCIVVEHFAVEYSFEPADDDVKDDLTLTPAQHYASCAEFANRISPTRLESSCRLLFLRGYPSAEWLGHIGARYHIDPELFVRFLNFTSAGDAAVSQPLPVIPATSWNLLEIPVVTIGERQAFHGAIDQASIDKMRETAKAKLKEHHKRLRKHTEHGVAGSVVRDIAIFDHGSFALEQRIWICMQRQPESPADSPWTLVVWTDSGRTPSCKAVQDVQVLPHEFMGIDTSLTTVIDYKPDSALAALEKFQSFDQIEPDRGTEAASQLCVGYGRTLSPDIMATDGFYALAEVFSLAIASVTQYLDLIEHKLAGFQQYGDSDMLFNLRYINELLYRQERQIGQVLAWLKFHRQHTLIDWRIEEQQTTKASKMADSVEHRYKYLQTHVKALQTQCKDSITNLMSSINVKEVKRTYDQSTRVARLTFLAAIFAPLAFTTSFYSMDVGIGGRSLGNWAAVTIVLMIITLFFMLFDFVGWVKHRYSTLSVAVGKVFY